MKSVVVGDGSRRILVEDDTGLHYRLGRVIRFELEDMKAIVEANKAKEAYEAVLTPFSDPLWTPSSKSLHWERESTEMF